MFYLIIGIPLEGANELFSELTIGHACMSFGSTREDGNEDGIEVVSEEPVDGEDSKAE